MRSFCCFVILSTIEAIEAPNKEDLDGRSVITKVAKPAEGGDKEPRPKKTKKRSASRRGPNEAYSWRKSPTQGRNRSCHRKSGEAQEEQLRHPYSHHVIVILTFTRRRSRHRPALRCPPPFAPPPSLQRPGKAGDLCSKISTGSAAKQNLDSGMILKSGVPLWLTTLG